MLKGDSGSVTVDRNNRVLGLNALAGMGGRIRSPNHPLPENTWFGMAFPIGNVLSTFLELGLDLGVGTASAPGQTHTVPGRATVSSLVDGESVVVALPDPDQVADAGRAAPWVPANAQRLAADLEESAVGRALLAFWHSHSVELRHLVNRDRRVAAAWHRSGASAVYHILLRGLDAGELRIPATVNDRPLRACLDALRTALAQSAGEALRRRCAGTCTGCPLRSRISPDSGTGSSSTRCTAERGGDGHGGPDHRLRPPTDRRARGCGGAPRGRGREPEHRRLSARAGAG
jgi:hypothetical protein